MKRIACAAVVLFGLVAAFSPTAGQQNPVSGIPQPGERIRLSTDSIEFLVGAYAGAPLRWQQGTLDSIGASHIWLRTRDMQLSVPLSLVKTMQVRRKRRSGFAFLAYGTLAGAALGTLTGLMSPNFTWQNSVDHLIVPFAGVGFGLSLVILPTMTEGWQSLPATP